MAKYRITYLQDEPEEVVAEYWEDAGPDGAWIDFTRMGGPRGSGERVKVLRVHANSVKRIERVAD